MLIMWTITVPTLAQEPPPKATPQPTDSTSSSKPAQVQQRGRTHWAVASSYGMAVPINGSKKINMGSMWARWTRVLGAQSSLAETKKFLGGQPAVGFELSPFGYFEQSPRAWGAAWHLVYEHRLRSTQKIRPVIRTGAGMLFTSRKVPPGEKHFNYTLFVGAGLELAVSKRQAIQVDYRLHHISNADTGPMNPGINLHTLLLGLAWGF